MNFISSGPLYSSLYYHCTNNSNLAALFYINSLTNSSSITRLCHIQTLLNSRSIYALPDYSMMNIYTLLDCLTSYSEFLHSIHVLTVAGINKRKLLNLTKPSHYWPWIIETWYSQNAINWTSKQKASHIQILAYLLSFHFSPQLFFTSQCFPSIFQTLHFFMDSTHYLWSHRAWLTWNFTPRYLILHFFIVLDHDTDYTHSFT